LILFLFFYRIASNQAVTFKESIIFILKESNYIKLEDQIEYLKNEIVKRTSKRFLSDPYKRLSRVISEFKK